MIQDYFFFVILGNQWQFQLVFSAIQISYFYLLQQSFTIVDYHFMQAQHLAPNNSQKNHSTETLNSILKNIAEKSLKITYQQLENMLAKPQIDRMLGCLYGAFLADSLGSFCQFKSKANCMKLSKSAMQMPGGGPFMLQPGQITDDSELALHMLAGLLAYDSKISLDKQLHILLVSIAKQYIQWWKNIPFDIGFTCRAAIVKLESHLAPYQELSEKGKQSASQKTPSFEQLHKKLIAAFADIKLVNQSSLSNGFLMKISPMVCFAVLIQLCKPDDVQTLTKLITYETNMTHSNKVCVSANISFVQMLSKIITRKDFNQISDILGQLQENFKGKSEDDVIGSAIQQAILSHANKDKDLMTADGRSAGFFKIAYYYTIYCFRQIATTCKSEQDLNRSDIYRNAIKMTIEQGGDTDTNACIVGAAVGSIIGFKNLPPQYLVKALSLKLGDSEFRKNQEFYDPANGFINLIKLIRKFM